MAKALGISERLLKNWVRDRVVPFTKIKRVVLFDPVKVEAALERFERQPRRTKNPEEKLNESIKRND
jgi:hypothetical protein